MAGRIRSIKPEWLDDEKLSACSPEARVLSVALILLADDYGRGRAGIQYLGAQVFAYHRDHHEKSREALRELVAMRYAAVYEVDGQSYFEVRNWAKHQRVDHPGKPRVPAPLTVIPENLAKVPESLARIPESLAPDLRPPTSDQDLRPPNTTDHCALGFDDFWEAYPRKVGKTAALKAWRKVRPPLSDCLEALGWQSVSEQWTLDGGRFVPHPATWINQGRWQDEKPVDDHMPDRTRKIIANTKAWLGET